MLCYLLCCILWIDAKLVRSSEVEVKVCNCWNELRQSCMIPNPNKVTFSYGSKPKRISFPSAFEAGTGCRNLEIHPQLSTIPNLLLLFINAQSELLECPRVSENFFQSWTEDHEVFEKQPEVTRMHCVVSKVTLASSYRKSQQIDM